MQPYVLSTHMTNQSEKMSFAKRLKKVLVDNQHPISPTYLSNEFNNRYDGQAISVQSANNWLLGKAIPNQDKLLILSIWLNVSSQWLRFGEESDETNHNYANSLSAQDLEIVSKFQKLSPIQKQILNSLIDELTR